MIPKRRENIYICFFVKTFPEVLQSGERKNATDIFIVVTLEPNYSRYSG